jgi:radical SAM family uncharacterized protein/radical SAM-linked protein
MNREELLKISKPARYLGGEINSTVKEWSRESLKFALIFPDVYEVGMSHLGFQILYHILNQIPEVACERFFAPWPDMENLLRGRNLPPGSLESSRPLSEFDILGFSLQYELHYTGVLNLLELAGIPLRSGDREERAPLIIGGGPCTMNPEPLADFFDLFVLGDGEEVVLEICREFQASREKGETKEELLSRLSALEGIYIPSFFRPSYEPDGRIREVIPLKQGYSTVLRRVLPDLNRGPFPSRPILPFMEVIHDRLNIEIARGCTRGCRFCQAGMIYRPLRERSAQQILQWVEAGLESTGYDDLSLLSLSTGDYSCIEPLLSLILDRTREERVAVSLPSLRVETLTSSLIQQIQEVRKTGFTLAPEAGTERLRRVINKGNTEEDLLATIARVFSANWRLVKLYFMIGLPTEAEEDLKGMVVLCQKALQVARRAKGSAQINISISTFVPKAHTPFQWEPQCSREEIEQKHHFLRRNLKRHGLHFKWADPRMSLLEGALARGDRRLGRVLQTACTLGCRLDGWGEHFRFDLWEKAFSQARLDSSFYLRERAPGEPLPWDHLDSRVTKYFLNEERKRAIAGIQTEDCRNAACNGCGVCYAVPGIQNRTADRIEPSPRKFSPPAESGIILHPPRRFRTHYAKYGPAKFLGHLEFSKLMIRAMRRARIPFIYSQGFHPLPKISFGPPLPVGHESGAEFLDLYLQEPFSAQELTLRLNKVLPQGVTVLEAREIALKSPSIFDSIITILYEVKVHDSAGIPEEKFTQFWEADSLPVFWPRKNREIDLKKMVESFSLADNFTVKLGIHCRPEGVLKPEETLSLILGWTGEKGTALSVRKIRVIFRDEDPCPAKS